VRLGWSSVRAAGANEWPYDKSKMQYLDRIRTPVNESCTKEGGTVHYLA